MILVLHPQKQTLAESPIRRFAKRLLVLALVSTLRLRPN
jgi:hypothetical protein